MSTVITIKNPTLLNSLIKSHHAVKVILIALVTTMAIWASAKIHIPFYPIPITMQTFVILFIGMAYGWRLGGLTVLFYLAEGALGLPVFSGTPEKGLGLFYMLGPTGGYLLGFLIAVMVVGKLAEKGWDRNIFLTFLAMVIGNLIIYTIGLLWLGNLLGWDKPVLAWGLYPFLVGGLFKIILASLLLPLIWKIFPKQSLKN